MVLRGLGRWWALILDCRASLASTYAVWVVLGSLGRWWALMLDLRVLLASV